MIYFLYHSGYETGFNLSKELDECLDKDFKPINKSIQYIKSKIKSGDILVRWGDSRDEELDYIAESRGARVLNKSEALSSNVNKLNSLNLFRSAGLNVPTIFTNKYKINTFPVLGRNKNHHGGLDIVYINGNKDISKNNLSMVPDKDFYVQYIESELEYRVHVFCGKIARITMKVFRGHDKDGNIIDNPGNIRNDTYGWGHSSVSFDEVSQAHKLAAVRAVKAVGLDFGAVDLLIDKNDNPYPLEVNSSPRLNSVGLKAYRNIIMNFYKPELTGAKTKEVIIKWS